MGKSRVLASTGGATLADIRTNLGLGTISTQASSNVSLTGGAVTANITSSNATITSGAVTASITSSNATITSGAVTANVTSSNAVITGGQVSGLSNLQVSGNITLSQAFFESANVTASAVTANITLVAKDSGICYFTSNATANTTVNLTGVLALGTGSATTYTLLMTNGATAYKVNTVQVEGAAANVRWSGGAVPTAGNAANVDIYSFTVIKTGTSAYSVFASQSQFG